MKVTKSGLKHNYHRIIGVCIAALFVIWVGYFNYLAAISFNYAVSDLGLVYRLMYLFHSSHTVIWYSNVPLVFSPIPFSKFIFVPLSFFLYLDSSFFIPLILQIVVLGIGGYALFEIALSKTNSPSIAIIIELAYFLYPATYGFMANGANYVGYVEPFVLIGYMFLIRKRYLPALFLFVLAAISNTWGPLIVILVVMIEISYKLNLGGLILKIREHQTVNSLKAALSSNRKSAVFYLVILITSATILTVVVYLEGGLSGALSNSRFALSAGTASSNGGGYGLFSQYLVGLGSIKLPFLNQILFPLLYLPAATLFIIPVILYNLVIWSVNPTINGAYFFLDQHYSYLFAAFLFLGLVQFVKANFNGVTTRKAGKKILILLLIASIVSFSLHSPFNISSIQNGTLKNYTNVTQFDKELTYGFSLIPLNSTVFIQNDMPQLMNRQQVYMPGYYQNQTVDYAVIIPFGFSPVSNAYGGYSPYWAEHFSDNASYGIYENILGAVVFKLGYHGKPAYLVPYTTTITPGVSGFGPANSASIKNGTIYVQNITQDETIWDNGYTNFYPGTYEINYSLATSNLSSENLVQMYAMINNGHTITVFGQLNVTGNEFAKIGEYQTFTDIIHITNYTEGIDIQFQASSNVWHGSLTLKSIKINQVG